MGIDESVLHLINRPGQPVLDAAMDALSALWLGLLLLGAGAVVLALKSKARWRAALLMVAVVGISDAFNARVVKPLAGRVRPCNERPPRSIALGACGRALSFPSTH